MIKGVVMLVMGILMGEAVVLWHIFPTHADFYHALFSVALCVATILFALIRRDARRGV